MDTGIVLHGFDHFPRLKRRRFEHRAGEMPFGRVAGETDDYTTGILVPMWRVKTCERRHKVDSAVVIHSAGQRFNVGTSRNEPKTISHPLHQCAGDGNAA